jgi:HPt (histidine-containing phosphotransfer) domain-containing protein
MPSTSDREGAQSLAGAQGNAGPIDHTVLDRLLSDDQEAVGVVLRQFCASCPGDAGALGVALSRNDCKGSLRWAHRLKGACQMIGAVSFADACGRAEVAVRAGDPSLIAEAVAEIDRESARVAGYLEAWLNASH